MKSPSDIVITTPSEREVVMTRAFDAPRALVFEAFTSAEILPQWLEAPGRAMTVCEVDLRVGGAYRFVWTGPGRKDVGSYGVYRDIVAPERVVRTEAWVDWDAGEVLVTTEFAEAEDQTIVTVRALFPSREIRDAVLEAGMKSGAAANYDRLTLLLARRQTVLA
ncbi:MAG TPA: SRPBCC domain-containing protein [Vicinamibacterales bacterium]|jgi:uncharacterized protein YndB with AHSA1/START domain